jgi:hypothetical protein
MENQNNRIAALEGQMDDVKDMLKTLIDNMDRKRRVLPRKYQRKNRLKVSLALLERR